MSKMELKCLINRFGLRSHLWWLDTECDDEGVDLTAKLHAHWLKILKTLTLSLDWPYILKNVIRIAFNMKSSIKVIKRMQFRPHYSSPCTEGRSPYWSLPWAAICGTHPSNNTHTHTSVPTFCSALLSSKLTDSLHLLCIHFSDPEVTSIFYRVYGCICGSLLAELSCLYGINSPTSDQN